MDKQQFTPSIKTGYANILKHTTQKIYSATLFQNLVPKDLTVVAGRKIEYSKEQSFPM